MIYDVLAARVPGELAITHKRYGRGGGALWSAAWKCWLSRGAFRGYSSSPLVQACAGAANAPRHRSGPRAGRVNEGALLAAVRTWLGVLWADLMLELPEGEPDRPPAAGSFAPARDKELRSG